LPNTHEPITKTTKNQDWDKFGREDLLQIRFHQSHDKLQETLSPTLTYNGGWGYNILLGSVEKIASTIITRLKI